MKKNPPYALVVVSKFAPHAGGTATVWTEWCRHWPAQAFTVVAPAISGSELFDKTQPYRIVRIAYPDIPKLRMPLLWLFLAARGAAMCLWRRPAVVHFQHVFENAFWGPFLRALLGVPYWVHIYGEELPYAGRYPWLKRWVRFVLDRAAGVTTISAYSLGLLREFGYHGPCLLVHPGVNGEQYCPGPATGLLARLGIPQGPTLLTVGRLMERKGQDTVIHVLPRLLEQFPDLHYVIAGMGPDQARLTQLVAQRGLGNRVHFLGRVPDDDLPQLMRECTLFVHPNRVTGTGDVEGFGIVFLEAASCGLPVIGGKTGGTPDSVDDGHSGYLVDPEDSEELVQKLTRLLEDSDLRLAMGQQGRKFAESFRWSKAARLVWEESLKTSV